MLTELTRPFSYLSIRHQTKGVAWINFWLPLIFSILVVGSASFLATPIDVFSNAGVLSKILGFIQNIPGFYLAALAAVATFTNSDMDNLMPGDPPIAKVLYNNHLIDVPLTRRRMLCIMFAYLTALSFLLVFITISVMTFAESAKAGILTFAPSAVVAVKGAFSVFYFGALFQMFIITSWGLFYLGERIHTPDR